MYTWCLWARVISAAILASPLKLYKYNTTQYSFTYGKCFIR